MANGPTTDRSQYDKDRQDQKDASDKAEQKTVEETNKKLMEQARVEHLVQEEHMDRSKAEKLVREESEKAEKARREEAEKAEKAKHKPEPAQPAQKTPAPPYHR
jgi:hypothetical protein